MKKWQCKFCAKIYRGTNPQKTGCKSEQSKNHMWNDISNNKGKKYQCTKCGKFYNGTSPTESGCPNTIEKNHMWKVIE